MRMAATAYFNKFPSYCRMVAHAKSLANRSILVDHCGLDHIDITSELPNVERLYSIEKESRRGLSKLSLIEFKSREDAERIAKSSVHSPGLLPVPLKILCYNGRLSADPPPQDLPFPVEHIRMSLDKELSPNFNSYTELVSNNLMSLVALKLRFITLVNFERILCSGVFQEYELIPFGSSVMNMGCDTGDLDLIFIKQDDHYEAIYDLDHRQRHRRVGAPALSSNLSMPEKLIHIDKSLYSDTKDTSGFRGTLRMFDNILREYMPLTDGFGVLTLHRAKVPIIKFTSRVTNIDCDLSFHLGFEQRENDSPVGPINHGILMTEILYSLCRHNNLITIFVIYLRLFAKLNGITSKVPGIGMTNFQFLSIVIFFLQNTSVTATSQDSQLDEFNIEDQSRERVDKQRFPTSFITKDQRFVITSANSVAQKPLIAPFKQLVDGDFLRELSNQTCHYDDEQIDQIMPVLIRRFFDWNATFDFNTSSLNLYEARREKKLDNSCLYVLNPIDRTRNICHNVNRKGLEQMVVQARQASHNIRAQAKTCPLTLMKSLLSKHQKQLKKNRSLAPTLGKEDVFQSFSPEDIAEDVCR